MQVHFDAALVHDRRALENWRQATSRLFYQAARHMGEVSVPSVCRLASMRLGGLDFVDVKAPPSVSSRDRRTVHQDGVDALFVSAMMHGRARLEVGSRSVPQRPGDIVLWDAAQPHRWIHEDVTASICVRVPRQWLKLSDPGRLHSRALSAGSPMSVLATSMIQNMSRLAVTYDGAVAHRLRSSLIDCLVAAFTAEHPGTARRNRLDDACDYMRSRLDDSRLTPGMVAAAVGLSERSLGRLFATLGTTPAAWLWQQRLHKAHELLACGQASVSEAATACGFTSFSHFSRAFRRAHGCAPSELRKARAA